MQKCNANDISIEQSDGCTGAQLRTLHWASSFQEQFHKQQECDFFYQVYIDASCSNYVK